MKRVALSVTNDLSNDRRVQRSISCLQDEGFVPLFIGRRLKSSASITSSYSTKRFRLWFNKGFLFYATFNLRLFFYLLFKKPFDLYWANDLDTLLPNYLVSKFYRKPLVYDSHEYFTGVPEIQGRPLVKAVWKGLESWIYPKVKYHLTVNNSIAKLLEKDYGAKPTVLRNITESYLPENIKSRKELGLGEDEFLLINQGAGINVDRGMEEALAALKLLDTKVKLVLVGKGDVLPDLKRIAMEEGMQDRIYFIAPLPYQDMLQYTLNADLGLSLDKDTNLNYRYSLPNKLFDYIKCAKPVLCSQVIEVRNIVEENNIGLSVPVEPKAIAEGIKRIRVNYQTFTEGLKKAAQSHNWEKEEQILIEFIRSIKL